MKYRIDNEHESSNTASQKELRRISDIITLHNHTHLSATILWTSLSMT